MLYLGACGILRPLVFTSSRRAAEIVAIIARAERIIPKGGSTTEIGIEHLKQETKPRRTRRPPRGKTPGNKGGTGLTTGELSHSQSALGSHPIF
jgi:hypothetical protein